MVKPALNRNLTIYRGASFSTTYHFTRDVSASNFYAQLSLKGEVVKNFTVVSDSHDVSLSLLRSEIDLLDEGTHTWALKEVTTPDVNEVIRIMGSAFIEESGVNSP